MAKSKRRKMFWIILGSYLLVSTIVYFLAGGFYFTKKADRNAKSKASIHEEFVYVEKDRVFKGVYTGIAKRNDKEYYSFQFPEILEGQNRLVDVFYPLEKDEDMIVLESNQKAEGVDAYLQLNPFGYYSGYNKSYDLIFKNDTLQHPKEFFELINENLDNAPDTIFVLTLTLISKNINGQLMQWTKNSDLSYTAAMHPENYAFEERGTCKINQVKRNPSMNGVIKVFAAISDIITGIIQGILLLLYFVLVLIMGGPVK